MIQIKEARKERWRDCKWSSGRLGRKLPRQGVTKCLNEVGRSLWLSQPRLCDQRIVSMAAIYSATAAARLPAWPLKHETFGGADGRPSGICPSQVISVASHSFSAFSRIGTASLFYKYSLSRSQDVPSGLLSLYGMYALLDVDDSTAYHGVGGGHTRV